MGTKDKCNHVKRDDSFDGKISQNVDRLEDGYAIGGCCGGGCYVITGIKFCPFCGVRL